MHATPHYGVSGQGPRLESRRNNIVRGGGRRRKVVVSDNKYCIVHYLAIVRMIQGCPLVE